MAYEWQVEAQDFEFSYLSSMFHFPSSIIHSGRPRGRLETLRPYRPKIKIRKILHHTPYLLCDTVKKYKMHTIYTVASATDSTQL